MKTISRKDFEEYFDEFIEDVVQHKRHYKIDCGNGKALVLLPADDYQFLLGTYEDCIKL